MRTSLEFIVLFPPGGGTGTVAGPPATRRHAQLGPSVVIDHRFGESAAQFARFVRARTEARGKVARERRILVEQALPCPNLRARAVLNAPARTS